MAMTVLIRLSFSILALYSMVNLSDQAIYPYHKAVSKTLRHLDLKSLRGQWFGVFHRNPKGEDEVCPQLNVVVGNGYVNVTEIKGNELTFKQRMEQNKYLEGKISQIIWRPQGYAVERPWFITQVKPVLVIYQVVDGNLENDNWSVYSRNPTPDPSIIESGAQRLVESGAVADENGNVGYHCRD